MSYSLEFYALPWPALGAAVRGRDRAAAEAAGRTEWPGMYEGPPERAGEAWRAALGELARAASPSDLPPGEPRFVGGDAALAIAALVRHLGRYHGSLAHGSGSGEEFLERFLGGVAARRLGEPRLMEHLTARALFGVAADEFPSWGGLRAAEVERLAAASGPSGEEELDEDTAAWLEELAALLRTAAGSRADVVTLYL